MFIVVIIVVVVVIVIVFYCYFCFLLYYYSQASLLRSEDIMGIVAVQVKRGCYPLPEDTKSHILLFN